MNSANDPSMSILDCKLKANSLTSFPDEIENSNHCFYSRKYSIP
jgi:hypothetical protein